MPESESQLSAEHVMGQDRQQAITEKNRKNPKKIAIIFKKKTICISASRHPCHKKTDQGNISKKNQRI